MRRPERSGESGAGSAGIHTLHIGRQNARSSGNTMRRPCRIPKSRSRKGALHPTQHHGDHRAHAPRATAARGNRRSGGPDRSVARRHRNFARRDRAGGRRVGLGRCPRSLAASAGRRGRRTARSSCGGPPDRHDAMRVLPRSPMAGRRGSQGHEQCFQQQTSRMSSPGWPSDCPDMSGRHELNRPRQAALRGGKTTVGGPWSVHRGAGRRPMDGRSRASGSRGSCPSSLSRRRRSPLPPWPS